MVGGYDRTQPTSSSLVVKKTGLLVEAKEDILDGLVDHCKIERPDSIGLAKVFKMLYSSSTPPPMDELTACIEKCVAELLHNVSAYCLNNFLTTLVNEVRRQLRETLIL